MGKKVTMLSTESSSIQERFERLMPSLFCILRKSKCSTEMNSVSAKVFAPRKHL